MPNINEYETDMNGSVTDEEVKAKLEKLQTEKYPSRTEFQTSF